MEIMNFSKFKLQLLALLGEVRDNRESEKRAKEDLKLFAQEHNQFQEELKKKIQELQEELALSYQSQRELENKVKYLQSSNTLLEQKQLELKATIDSLIHSRGSFSKLYEESNSDLRHCIEAKDRKILLLSQRLEAHLKLFDCIKSEAYTLKQVLERIERVVSSKERIVNELKGKMDNFSKYEKEFGEKILFLQNKLLAEENELQAKNATISGLREELAQVKLNTNLKQQIEEISFS